MEVVEKRKRNRLEEGEDDGKKMKASKSGKVEEQKKTGDVNDEDEDNDGQVEEFFAILRRIHVAVKYFEKDHGGHGRRTIASLWNPNFVREDFEGNKVEKRSETVAENVVLDLNADPNND